MTEHHAFQQLRNLTPILLTVFCLLFLQGTPKAATVQEFQAERTTEVFRRIKGLQQEQIEAYTARLQNLSYTRQRLFRALCTLPEADHQTIETLFQLAARTPVRFNSIPLLELYTSCADATLAGSRDLLQTLQQTSFVSEQVMTHLANVQTDKATILLDLIASIQKAHEAAQWAIQSLLTLPNADPPTLFGAITLLSTMSDPQCRAAEKGLLVPGLRGDELLPLLSTLKKLNQRDAINIRSLFSQPTLDVSNLPFWLHEFFATSSAERDTSFETLPADRKTLLLYSYHHAARDFIWQINNLHDITDRYGREIGSGRLAGSSTQTLTKLFARLDPVTRKRFQIDFDQAVSAGNKGAAIALLRQATGQARKQTAKILSSANIYILLANGGELYDSSFRDILAPVLKKRINQQYGDKLLDFLLATDPNHLFISDFITHLAHKGRLTLFFPADTGHQQRVLELVTESALKDQESLILFSATFSRLLAALQPSVRSYLIGLLLRELKDQPVTMKRNLRVILQYYLENLPNLLSADDKAEINQAIQQYGLIDLAPYTRAPFDRWKQDGRLTGLSIFQDDDDGRSSYASYSLSLFEHGYKPSISPAYSASPMQETATQEANHLFYKLPSAPAGTVYDLFRLANRFSLAIDWQKRVNNLEVTHTLYVYQDRYDQKKLLRTFLTSGHEMFAQRGHSYWRHEQLFEPLETLLEDNAGISDSLQSGLHFISLGSCGGMRAYSRINRIFNNDIAILATIGTGKAAINNPYNRKLFEIVASNQHLESWKDIEILFKNVFNDTVAGDYIQPGSLPAILHRLQGTLPTDETSRNGTD